MLGVWQRIEAWERNTFSFLHMAQAFVTAAAAITLALGVYLYAPSPPCAAPLTNRIIWKL